MAKKLERIDFADFESEKRYNDYVREKFIEKLLAELTVDLQICQIMKTYNQEADDPLNEWKKYLEKIKKEIDRLYDKINK